MIRCIYGKQNKKVFEGITALLEYSSMCVQTVNFVTMKLPVATHTELLKCLKFPP